MDSKIKEIKPTWLDRSEHVVCSSLTETGDNDYTKIANELPTSFMFGNDTNMPPEVDGRYFLNEFFAKAYKVMGRANNIYFDDKADWDDSDYQDDLLPPFIYSLNPYTCFENRDEVCSAWEVDAFTINRRNYVLDDYNNDGKNNEEDTDKDSKVDPLVFLGSISVSLDFFAVADDNRMPIRRVMVDWTDGKVINQKRLGFYQNRKPFCELSDGQGSPTIGRCEYSNITCQDDLDCIGVNQNCDKDIERYFGDSARACQPNYFEFGHYYSCTDNELSQFGVTVADLTLAEREFIISNTSLNLSDKVCKYKPRVQVLDNWGWCNGVDGNGEYKGYYNDGIYELCSYENEDAWTPYKGQIIVVPQ